VGRKVKGRGKWEKEEWWEKGVWRGGARRMKGE
jgi:hypothetical protein